MPVISTDYLFLTARGCFARREYEPLEGEEHLKVLVVYDSLSKALFAHAVPQKGVDERGYIVDKVSTDILWLGYARVIVRSDNEPAIVKVVEEVLKTLKITGLDQAAAEGSVPYDPQSNGAAESAVRLLKGSVRTLQLGLERQIRARIPVGHPIMSWLVRHAACVRTLRMVGADGLSAYQRVKGRDTAGPKLIGFGENCCFKTRSQEKHDGSWIWSTGVWLGLENRSGQYVIWSTEGIKHARTIMCVPEPQTHIAPKHFPPLRLLHGTYIQRRNPKLYSSHARQDLKQNLATTQFRNADGCTSSRPTSTPSDILRAAHDVTMQCVTGPIARRKGTTIDAGKESWGS